MSSMYIRWLIFSIIIIIIIILLLVELLGQH